MELDFLNDRWHDILDGMTRHERTIQTYDAAAPQLAAYFAGHGARTVEIEHALQLAGSPANARVIEVGCGDGRDAAEIVPKAGWYEGFDPSAGLLAIARERLPQASFVLADALSYNYPENTDVVFAFASLLHVDRRAMPPVFSKVAACLRPNGIFYLSLKEREEYAEELQTDQFGKRMFYYYTPPLIEKLASTAFTAVYEDHYVLGKGRWFRMALKRA
ncbi:MAG TPA: class I SAM-dependent methyltransferase [Candidatus Saccharimonadales bacterium]|nr:class I SAM-dependent methyltransferase [Candidatus Saccharimonadales bacterium]